MPLANIAYFGVLTWADPTQTVLEDQARVPLFGKHPVELGLAEDGKPTLDAAYQKMFAAAFPNESGPWTFVHVKKALASFERTLISGRSPYDRYRNGDESAISESAKRGEDLFFHQPQSCSRCYGGLTFGGSAEFFNTGLYNPFPADNTGIFAHTHNPDDMGKFRAASLRNVAVRAPYMHDGSIATLDQVLDHYAAGGRSHNPKTNRFVGGFTLTAEQRADLIEFLKSLTDEEFLHDPRFSDPWKTTPAVP
jgi:cytochrome c peroxidase